MPTAIKRAAKAKPSLKRVSAEVAKLPPRYRVELVDGYITEQEYYQRLSRAKVTFTYVHRWGLINGRALEAISQEEDASAAVAPSSAEARRALDNEMARPATNLDVGIANFGDGLHPFEDSWAHQGIPDTPWPWFCDPELSWGHPVERGGWRSHDADLTYLDPKSTLDMARGTWQQLCAYARSVLKKDCKTDFESLLPAIRAFSRAQTKEQKRAWFTAHKFGDTRFLKYTSLPRGERYRAEFEPTLTALSSKRALEATEENRFMLAFLEQWMTTNSHENLAKRDG
ncbi:MAG: hypothetical protein HC872_05270 [Gammaproteobacteria bacterium]|nr:hypothetical protein [Gammaproteobacteria bacterium]